MKSWIRSFFVFNEFIFSLFLAFPTKRGLGFVVEVQVKLRLVALNLN